MRSLRRGGAILLGSAVFVVCVWYITRTFRWREIGQILRTADLACIIFGGGLSIMLYWLLRATRWHILLSHVQMHVSFLDLYLCTAVSLSFSLFTPLQSGEIAKIELLKKYGMIPRLPGYASFLVERVVDLGIVVLTACLSLLFVLNILPNRSYAYCALGILVICFAAGFLLLWKVRLKGRVQEMLDQMRHCIGDARTLSLVVIVSCLSWASVAFSWQIFLYGGSIHLGFVRSVALMSVVALVSILSLVPGGLGISELSSAQVLTGFGFAAPTAQAGALVLRSYSLVAIALGLGHLGVWQLVRVWRRKRARRAAAKEPGPASSNSMRLLGPTEESR